MLLCLPGSTKKNKKLYKGEEFIILVGFNMVLKEFLQSGKQAGEIDGCSASLAGHHVWKVQQQIFKEPCLEDTEYSQGCER